MIHLLGLLLGAGVLYVRARYPRPVHTVREGSLGGEPSGYIVAGNWSHLS